MEYDKTTSLKDGRSLRLRNGVEQDARAALEIFILGHEQTDYLLSYPDENDMTVDEEAQFLAKKTASADEIELLAEFNPPMAGFISALRDGVSRRSPSALCVAPVGRLDCSNQPKVVGLAGIQRVGAFDKVRRRATFGLHVDQNYWGLGIGRALTRACVECARIADYAQLELEVVAENERAIALYLSEGFVGYGRNPRGFLSRQGGWRELVLMRLELD